MLLRPVIAADQSRVDCSKHGQRPEVAKNVVNISVTESMGSPQGLVGAGNRWGFLDKQRRLCSRLFSGKLDTNVWLLGRNRGLSRC